MDLNAIRTGLYEALSAEPIDGIREVSRGAVDGVPALPAVIIGVPTIDLDKAGPCMDEVTWPIAVAVARDATDDQHTIDTLDRLLAQVVGRLRDLAGSDLGGTVNDWRPTRTDFGGFRVGSTELPAHLVYLTIHAR